MNLFDYLAGHKIHATVAENTVGFKIVEHPEKILDFEIEFKTLFEIHFILLCFGFSNYLYNFQDSIFEKGKTNRFIYQSLNVERVFILRSSIWLEGFFQPHLKMNLTPLSLQVLSFQGMFNTCFPPNICICICILYVIY